MDGVGDTDAYGEVEVPGKAQVPLPEGEVAVYFGQSGVPDKRVRRNAGFASLKVLDEAGGELRFKGQGTVDETVNDGGLTRVNYEQVVVPRDGDYTAIATLNGPGAGAAEGATLSFGRSLTDSVVGRAKDALWGLLGFVLAAMIALGTFLTGQRSRDETVTMPPQE